MRQKELIEKAQLLKAGQIVEISGDYFQAVFLGNDFENNTCMLCDLDSICRGDVFDVCCEMETMIDHHWMLRLAHP